MEEKILIVDDEAIIREFLHDRLTELGYQCDMAENGIEAVKKALRERFALVLLDIKLPLKDGVQVLHEIKANSKDTAVVMMTSVADTDIAIRASRLGAYDYVTKPFNPEGLIIVVERALEKRRLILENRDYQLNLERKVNEQTRALREAFHSIERSYQGTLEALVTALDMRERETQAHSRRVMEYALHLARRAGITDRKELEDIGRGALLHDIGKIGIPDHILLKPGPLTASEWAQMRKHPEIGYQIIKDIEFLRDAAQIVLEHQEMYDGSGYPRGLIGEQICLGARIFAIVDALDCMTSDRPYRKARTYEEARSEIIRFSGLQFDPHLVKVFLQIPPEEWWEIRRRVGR